MTEASQEAQGTAWVQPPEGAGEGGSDVRTQAELERYLNQVQQRLKITGILPTLNCGKLATCGSFSGDCPSLTRCNSYG